MVKRVNFMLCIFLNHNKSNGKTRMEELGLLTYNFSLLHINV